MATQNFQKSPPATSFTHLSFPAPQVLLVTLSRPRALNCINSAGHNELDAIWSWLDAEPTLLVGIVTGEGRAFCAGADLKEWDESQKPGSKSRAPIPPSGFGGLSRRHGQFQKPIIAAVNGLAHGGGCEMLVNCDIVVASPSAVFALPEVKRGVVALAGALPRLTRVIGRMRAMEMALLGKGITSQKAREWGLCNAISARDGWGENAEEGVVRLAVEWAGVICEGSPDSVIVSKEGVERGWEGIGVEEGSQRLVDGGWSKMEGGENMKEGVRAFVEKRAPRWVPSAL